MSKPFKDEFVFSWYEMTVILTALKRERDLYYRVIKEMGKPSHDGQYIETLNYLIEDFDQ